MAGIESKAVVTKDCGCRIQEMSSEKTEDGWINTWWGFWPCVTHDEKNRGKQRDADGE